MTRDDLRPLLEFSDAPSLREKIQAAIDHGIDGGARHLGLNLRTYRKAIRGVKMKAALRGFSPDHDWTNPVPPTHVARGVSTYYNEDGKPVAQWVKADLRKEAQDKALRETIEALRETIPRVKPVLVPRVCAPDLLNLYVITDFHLGALAWGEETRGDDWDTDIAEDLLVRWFGAAIAQSPPASVGVFAQLGDLLHYDSLSAVTPTSGHILDADTRYQKLIRVVIRALRRVIAMLLQKHERVVLIMAEGNHDMASSAWLREVFSTFYESEPRITVDTSPDPYYCVEHGQTALFFHHGHLKKFEGVDKVFTAKFRDVFGRTKHAFGHLGHYHHKRELESPLMVLRQHRTLAASDAYASRGGWMSGREAQVITYSAQHGEVGSVTISPAMVV